ncbi:MAG: hypothetical protein DMG12_15795 [Acidobacteria bacterium]|nr:MAG: hypothetical protein DMG12_15795 [Acidobacteriota bacterium]
MVTYILLIAVSFGSIAAAQNSAEIEGTVRDITGAVLPGVAITIISRGSGQERQHVSDANGRFVASTLSPGDYTIRAELLNFKTQVREGVVLQVGDRARVDLVMEVGAISEEVTVRESLPLMRTSNAEVSEIIDKQRLAELPLNGRQFVQLTLLSDNVYLTPVGTRGAALAQTGRQVVVGGQRVGHNMYFLDGVSITDQYLNNLVLSPAIDLLQEFKIQKSIYSAEYGGKSSANVNAVTKSGTNDVHGSLYEFLRNDIFDTRNYFDDPTRPLPPLRQNQFGGTLGGPVHKDQSFIFLNYEGFRERRALTRLFSLPSAKVRNGDFSGLSTIYDPLTTDPVTKQRRPFPGNQVTQLEG